MDGAWSASFTIDGRAADAEAIVALASDLTVWRNSTKLFRGRIGPEQDDITDTVHTSQFTAIDYRGMLAYRIVGENGADYVSTAQGEIAWDLIETSQALDGGDWGVTDGLGSGAGTARDRRDIPPGTPILQLIEQLGRVDNGFEWEIDADLALNRWYPRRGTDNGRVLTLGAPLRAARRVLNPGDFANAALVTGSDETVPSTAETATIATDLRGRWEVSQSFVSIKEQNTLDDRATWLVDEASVLRPEWNVTWKTNAWGGPTDVWVGDIVQLNVQSGRLSVSGAHRVVEMEIALGDDGDEQVTAGLIAEPDGGGS